VVRRCVQTILSNRFDHILPDKDSPYRLGLGLDPLKTNRLTGWPMERWKDCVLVWLKAEVSVE